MRFDLPSDVEGGMLEHRTPVGRIVGRGDATACQIVDDAWLVRHGEAQHVEARAGARGR